MLLYNMAIKAIQLVVWAYPCCTEVLQWHYTLFWETEQGQEEARMALSSLTCFYVPQTM